MGKYGLAESEIFSAFGSAEWTEKSFPAGFDGEKGNPPYVRITIVQSGPPLNARSTSGVLQVEIFTAWGKGPNSASLIADKLDNLLQRKTFGTTQLFNSSMDRYERDKDNAALGRCIYSLPFSHFGVN